MNDPQSAGLEFLSGGGQMGERIRAHAWQDTPLGPPEKWPQGLRTALRILLTTQHPVFIFWGADLTCFYNDAYSRSIGPEQHPSMLGQPAREQWPLIWDVIGPQIEQVMSGGAATWHENQKLPIHRNGRIEDVYWTYSYGPIDEPSAPNNVGGVLVICTETTRTVLSERHAAEERERLAALFELTPSFMAVLRGPTHVFEMANPVYRQLINNRDVIGKTVAEGLPETVEQGFLDLLDEVYATGKAFIATGTEYTSSPGSDGQTQRRYLDFVYQPILDEHGQVNGVFVEGIDTTDRILAEQALRDADRRKDEFLAMLAHELRNPLAPIRNAAQILARRLVNDRQAQQPIAMIQRQVTHLTRLVDDLLDVSRISQGRIELRLEDLTLSQAIDQAIESVSAMAREKEQRLTVDSNFETVWVNADRARLAQIFVNVLTNAVKYTQNGGNIRVEVQPAAERVSVVISDDGAGITAELLPRVFDMFVQADRTLDRAQGGLGIGLSVVRKLVEMHRGEVIARSDGLGRGASFEVRLPRIEAPLAVETEARRSRFVKRRVLVVDDNADAANSLVQLLRLEGHAAEAAFTARSGLDRFQAYAPEVVLLDIGLPEMDGYEVARTIRRGTSSTAVKLIALTGYGQAEDRERALNAGFDEHLVKPVEFDALQRVLMS
jgi:signal transduction histidine kinase